MKTVLRFAGSTALMLIMGANCFGQRYTQTNLVSNASGIAPVTDPQVDQNSSDHGNGNSSENSFVDEKLPKSYVPFNVQAIGNDQDVALERTRVASGEYRIVEQNEEGGIGLFAPGVYNFRESWTIWRLNDGSFEVEGERSYESPKGELQNNGFHVRLSSAFRVLGVKESRKLRWRHDSAPLACDFLSDGIVCSSASSVPDQSIRWDMPAKEPYGFFWPLSAFSLASIARSADRDPTRESQVQLLTLHEPNATFPIFGTVMDAQLRYSGQEQITVADRQWNAEKFELTVFLYSKFVIWVSPDGLLLAFGRGTGGKPRTERAMTLVSFQQWTKF